MMYTAALYELSKAKEGGVVADTGRRAIEVETAMDKPPSSEEEDAAAVIMRRPPAAATYHCPLIRGGGVTVAAVPAAKGDAAQLHTTASLKKRGGALARVAAELACPGLALGPTAGAGASKTAGGRLLAPLPALVATMAERLAVMAGVDQKALDARIADRAAVPMNQRLSNDIRSYASAEQVISYLHALGAVPGPKVEALKRVLLEHGAAPPTKSDVMAGLNEEPPAHLVAARCQLMKKNAKAKPTPTPLAYTPAGIEGVLEKRVKDAIAAGEFRNYDGAIPGGELWVKTSIDKGGGHTIATVPPAHEKNSPQGSVLAAAPPAGLDVTAVDRAPLRIDTDLGAG